MRALLTKIRGDLRRRRLQACIIALIVAMATGVGTLALELLNESSAPYTRAFEQYQGAHLTVFFDTSLVTPDQLAATTHLAQVTASAGPWQTINTPLEFGAHKSIVNLIARADPGGGVDRLLITNGRWATQPGEIVLTRSFAQSLNLRVGDKARALSGPDRPQLTVVGEVADIDEGPAGNFNPQFAWVQPVQFAAIASSGAKPTDMMVYRFHDAATDAAMQQRSQEIAAAVPPNAVSGSYTHLLIQQVYGLATTLTLTFLLAFSIFALGAASLIVANLVSGAVLTSRRVIGVVRALGFTPGQVVTTFVGQMLAPAFIGCLIGVPLGVLGSRPLVSSSADALGLPAPSGLDPVAPILATVGGLLIVAVAAAVPALRAGLLRPVDAISPVAPIGRHQRSRLGGLLQRARLPLPVTLGARDSFVRPVRGILTTVAVVIGVATLVFAFGVRATFQQIGTNRGLLGIADVNIARYGSYPDRQLMATLNAQPETREIQAFTFFNLTIPQLSSPVTGLAERGAPGPHGVPVLAGRWVQGSGEIIGGPAFFKESHLKIGDTIVGSLWGKPVTLRLVGEYFGFDNFGRSVRIDWSSLAAVDPSAQPDTYLVNLRPGASVTAFTQRVAATAPDFLDVTSSQSNVAASIIGTLDTVLAALAIILAAIAIAGVFNTLLLTSYERVRDTATLKALGMTPGQVIGMVVSSACVIGLLGGVVGVPLGVWLHQALLTLMGSAIGESLPAQYTHSNYNVALLPLLALAGLLVAVLGAALPAWLAARAPVAEVLRAE